MKLIATHTPAELGLSVKWMATGCPSIQNEVLEGTGEALMTAYAEQISGDGWQTRVDVGGG